ncbi:protein with tetrapyrrole methyltransferase and pyrophosphatase domains [Mycolicibacterium chubuense NBB4]|uniref:Protein with tetrapyrrole methyltransferase and pyrophosphatase domains n=1 Tax=Mycolicibacterium chubuense (strain NBB4) TaxID=710421 RepID=I4BNN5_MYCCN|nr:nucleoside triphosphate pyrophosphohydrolase [Mycolicibacterium chubuense]AFM18892.1 protein with tetrapyrrole methyltransferase and pyrophosphatase domains [Mycolicibacterium chubuense NBB4]
MTVVLVDPRRPSLIPVEAIELLSGDVQYTEEMPIKVPWSLPSARPAYEGEPAATLLSSDRDHPSVATRIAAGERVICAPEPQPGERLVDAVALMDTLRTAGPWESQQTHDSLRRYLLEETYELFDAVHGGDLAELRDELGDVLLQVLFHARIAEDAPEGAFDIDDVADALVRKLGHRVPAVLAGESISLEEQLAQWEQRKALETSARESSMDGIPTGQPALALAQKVLARAENAGVPAELVPAALTTVTVSAEFDAENGLRTAILEFMADVRAAERSVAAARRRAEVAEELDDTPVGVITPDEWHAHWPDTGEPEAVEYEVPDEEAVADEPEAPDEEAPDEFDEPEATEQEPEPAEQ